MERLSTRSAKAHGVLRRRRVFRWLGGRGAATLVLGAALSVGGVAEVMDNVHFVVRKDLDGVRVVENSNGHRQVVATLADGFAANSVFKLSRALPDKLVSRQNDLFTPSWMTEPSYGVPPQKVPHDVFHQEMARISGTIRRDFFQNAIPFGDIIQAKALKYDVDPALVAAVVETESRFRSGARSQVGARGLMQIMPRTLAGRTQPRRSGAERRGRDQVPQVPSGSLRRQPQERHRRLQRRRGERDALQRRASLPRDALICEEGDVEGPAASPATESVRAGPALKSEE
jgi:hypothetical protein